MYIIGVTGGVGAGKSAVLDYLQEAHGAVIVRLDDVSRSLLDVNGRCYSDAVRLFGDAVVREDGTLDRPMIADRIFSDEGARKALDDLIHPAVKEETLRLIEEGRAQGCGLFVIEAALLIEDNYDAICDEMWYIYADADTRCRRLASSRGYSAERIRGTMAGQLSDEAFRAHTDLVIDNSGEFDRTKRLIDERIRAIAALKAEEDPENQ